MFVKKSAPLHPKIQETLEALRAHLARVESDTLFQDAYLAVPVGTRMSKTFGKIVYQDLVHAFIYAIKDTKQSQLRPEICATLIELVTGNKVNAEKAAKALWDDRLKDSYDLTEDTPLFLNLFKDSPEKDFDHVAPLMVELKSTWENVMFALMDTMPESKFCERLGDFLLCADSAVAAYQTPEVLAALAAAAANNNSTGGKAGPSTEVAVIEPPAPPFTKETLNKLWTRAYQKSLPVAAMNHLERELKTLDGVPETSSDFSKNLQPLVTLVDMPWHDRTPLLKDIHLAEQRMDEKHAGLKDVKGIVTEYLAAQMRKGKSSGTILCFDGPPGVGKTSLANAIAYALGRPIVRIALGGTNDSHDLRGHRSTYIGAKPGRIINGILQSGVRNPIILLDEIDKIDQTRGNLEATLLEVLDPEQNANFTDLYLDTAFDLSEVMFIATSNNKRNIMSALRDRMEIVDLPPYSPEEKLDIAQTHLVPRARQSCGLSDNDMSITTDVIKTIIDDYVYEAGVRSLERALMKIARNSAYKLESGQQTRVDVSVDDLPAILGRPHEYKETLTDEPAVGVVNGLYVGGGAGGGIMSFETIKIPSKGDAISVTGTGLMKETMKESLSVVTSWLRAHAESDLLKDANIHKYQLHIDAVMDGPKDGPSAGIAITTASVSVLTDKPIPHDLAMTGKMTLGGRVRAVGGIMQKLEGALKGGMTTVLIPHDNIRDLEDVREEVKRKLKIIPVKTIDDVLSLVFNPQAVNQSAAPAKAANDNKAARLLPVVIPAQARTPTLS